MKLLKILLALVMLLVLCWSSPVTSPDVVAADEIVPPCTVSLSGTTATIVCSGIKIGTVEVPVIKVTSPPLPPVTQIVKIPPVKASTIKVPGPTKTVTVTKPAKPRATVTKTVRPLTPQDTPHVGITPRQTPTNRATIGPATPVSPSPNEESGGTTIIKATLGIISILAFAALLLLTLYAGYVLGFREARNKDATFMKSLLEISRGRRRQ